MGVYSRGDLKPFLVVGQIPVEMFLQRNNLFDATLTSNRKFIETQADFC